MAEVTSSKMIPIFSEFRIQISYVYTYLDNHAEL